MDQRLYFVLGDLFANLLTGAVVGYLCWAIVEPGWNMWLTMFAMMGFGMLLALVLFFPLGYFFGAMEVMVPTMLTGMVSGMVVSMRAAMHMTSGGDALLLGLLCGLACIVAVWVLNNSIRGEVTIS